MARDRAPDADVARERVQRLLSLAREAALDGAHDRAARYGELAWRVTTRYTLTPPPQLKARVCRSCYAYLVPGETSRVRTTGGKVSATCTACGAVRRVPFTDEQKARRRAGAPPADE